MIQLSKALASLMNAVPQRVERMSFSPTFGSIHGS